MYIMDELTSSDVVRFVAEQPDFHEFGLGEKELAIFERGW